ncbi:hypothetical protein [Actinomadura rudentiformis]|uniref:Sulfotransferase family protein n=1 Tax=Actinomadura rudentiformis TaxID=359158 RepID=A0A6H9Z3D3_9ACTN|nr:hypothetical protein [Actinomadura rudentiformis]KAB2347860.1 hypothetical protein F8566_18390 [Actinomadura rudentiformis]
MNVPRSGHAGDQAVKTVYLHVGAPATGTAFLQQTLWDNRLRLGDAGVCYPVAGPLEHFGAVMDLREMAWGGRRDPAWDGAWDRMAQRARDWDGHTVIFSQGLLGGATEQQVKRAVADLEPAKVHVVYMTRHLGWQLIVDWQEHLRHGHTITFESFVDDLVERGIKAPKPYGELFWGLHDPERVLQVWETAVPSDRIHVITLPPPGDSAGPDLVWERFCALTGIEAGAFDVSATPEDEPLSATEAEILRRLNTKIAPLLGTDHKRMVRQYLVGHGLADGADAVGHLAMGLPARHADWAAERTRQLTGALRAGGYQVVGDLDELVTSPRPEPARQPEDLPDELIATAFIGVVAHLLERLSDGHARIGLAHLNSQLAGVQENLDRLIETAAAPSPALQRAARRAAGRRAP